MNQSPPALFSWSSWPLHTSSTLCVGLGSVYSGSGSCMWVCFPNSFPTLCMDSIVSPFWLGWVQDVFLFRCNPPPALLVEWLGSFICYCSSTGVEQFPKWEWAQKVNSAEDKSPTSPVLDWTHNLLVMSLVFIHWATASPLGGYCIVLIPVHGRESTLALSFFWSNICDDMINAVHLAYKWWDDTVQANSGIP